MQSIIQGKINKKSEMITMLKKRYEKKYQNGFKNGEQTKNCNLCEKNQVNILDLKKKISSSRIH